MTGDVDPWTLTDRGEGPVVPVHEAFNAIRATFVFVYP